MKNKSENLGKYSVKGKSPFIGVKQSPEFIKKRTKNLKGRVFSKETIKKMSIAHTGKKTSKQTKKKLQKAMMGNKHLLGFKFSDESKKKLSNYHRENCPKGENHWNWKGGVTLEKNLIRASALYREWRTGVFKRDNYTCKLCGETNTYIEADHIKPFAYYPESRFDLNNGRTLCKNCHKKVSSTIIGSKRKDNYERNFLAR
jgi:hypothetical protein